MSDIAQRLSPDHLIKYPAIAGSNYPASVEEADRFNRAYERAEDIVNSSGMVREMFLIQFRANSGKFYYQPVMSDILGNFELTDIVAVIAKARH